MSVQNIVLKNMYTSHSYSPEICKHACSVKGGAKQGCTRHDVKNVHNSYNFKHVRNTYSFKTCTECVHLLKGKHLPRKQYEIRTIVRSAYVVA